jgi:hypothetical protein
MLLTTTTSITTTILLHQTTITLHQAITVTAAVVAVVFLPIVSRVQLTTAYQSFDDEQP